MGIKDKKEIHEKKINIISHQKCEMPKITVIVPVYKVDRYLTQCLNSIVNQTMEELEIIIVDEGDKDRCREIIDYFEAHDPRIIAPHQKNGGYGASCNLGFQIAKGEYISIIESDDFIDRDMYEIMYEYAKTLDADVVKTPYKEFFQNGVIRDCQYRSFLNECLPENKTFSMKEYGQLLEVHASLWSGIYKRSYLKEKNIRFAEAKGAAYVDVGFRIDTLINSEKIAWLNHAFYNYRVDSIGSSTNTFKLAPMINRWKEQHKKFNEIYEEYTKYYAPHILLDEYLNTVGWLNLIDATDEEYKEIHQNLARTDLDIIKNSSALSLKQKDDLILFIQDPSKFKRQARVKRNLKNISTKVMIILDKLSNTILLFWFFIMTFSAVLAQIMIGINLNLEERIPILLFRLSGTIGFLSFLGCVICCIGKSIRKLYHTILEYYNKKREKKLYDYY